MMVEASIKIHRTEHQKGDFTVNKLSLRKKEKVSRNSATSELPSLGPSTYSHNLIKETPQINGKEMMLPISDAGKNGSLRTLKQSPLLLCGYYKQDGHKEEAN